MRLLSIFLLASVFASAVIAEQCGSQAGGELCPDGLCCSQWGWCGDSSAYCGTGCQSGCGNSTSTSASLPRRATTSTTEAASTSTAQAATTTPSTSSGLAPVFSTCSNSGSFALTFDDGPTESTKTLLDVLKSKGQKATFFVNGLNYGCIYDHADVIQRIDNEGHQLASHTWSHLSLPSLSDDQMRLEMTKLEDAFRKIIGKVPQYMRPPYGDGVADTRVRTILGSLGYTMITWDIDSGDSAGLSPTQSEQVYKDSIGAAPFPKPHIALNHDAMPNTDSTLAPAAIDFVKSQGYTLDTVGTCLGDDSWYKESTTPSARDSSWVC